MTGEPVSKRATTALPDAAWPPRPQLGAAGSRPSGPWPAPRRAAMVCLAALWLLCLAGVPAPARAAGAPGSSAGEAHGAARGAAPAADDPVVGQVLEMLRGGVTEPVIVAWLEKSGNRPPPLRPRALIPPPPPPPPHP